MQGNPSNQLNIVVSFPDDSPSCFTDQGKGFGEQVVESFSIFVSFLIFLGLIWKISILQLFHLWFQFIDADHQTAVAFEGAIVFATEDLLDQFHGFLNVRNAKTRNQGFRQIW